MREVPPPEDVQATFAATLVDEWARRGVRAAVVCPGSRSTPLALALSDHPDVAIHVHHDERSGGFLALGLAAASGRAVVVLTTSGTATAELHPAVVEAHHSGVPLLVCTADRPPELQDVGAPQTIDQTHLYGRSVRWYSDLGVPDAAAADRWRPWAARALAEAEGTPPGPVQLNLPFREPLVGTPGPLPPPRPSEIETEVVAQQPLLSQFRWGSRRGVIVAGYPGPEADDVVRLAGLLGWPVVADPRSTAWTTSPVSVPHLDAILRSERAREVLRPEVIVRLGAPPASRVVNEWFAASGATEIVVSGLHPSDPAGTATAQLPGHPADVVRAWLEDPGDVEQPPGWLEHWQTAADAAAQVLDDALATAPAPNEPGVARDVVAGLPAGAALVVSSSMPIRDVERYAVPRGDVRVWSNRGANGIDGVVSTAVGVALAGRPTGLLIGDLAFLHDSNGLLGIAGRDVDLVCVVVDNDGGGIFSFLPQAGQLGDQRFEQLFGTPHGLDLVALARAYGVAARALDPAENVEKAVAAAAQEGGVHILVARTERGPNVDVHQLLDAAVATAVDTALP